MKNKVMLTGAAALVGFSLFAASVNAQQTLCGEGVRNCYSSFDNYGKQIPERTMGYVRSEPGFWSMIFMDGMFIPIVPTYSGGVMAYQ